MIGGFRLVAICSVICMMRGRKRNVTLWHPSGAKLAGRRSLQVVEDPFFGFRVSRRRGCASGNDLARQQTQGGRSEQVLNDSCDTEPDRVDMHQCPGAHEEFPI